MANILLLVIQDCAPGGSQAKESKVVVILMEVILKGGDTSGGNIVSGSVHTLGSGDVHVGAIYDGDIDRNEY